MDYLHLFTEPMLLVWLAVGVFAGVYTGAIPGLSGTMAVSLLVSMTYGWDAEPALCLMLGVYVGVVFGGSRSAILLNIPGAPAAVATGLDGYPLAKKGRAGETMAAAAIQSVAGTVLGALALLLCAPLLSKLSLKFRSVDYLLLAILGMLTVGSLSSKSLLKGVLSAALGVLVGCVGMDPVTAVKRFTFGSVYLNGGVSFVVALIGLFGAGEAFCILKQKNAKPVMQKSGRIVPPMKEIIKYIPLTLRSALIGIVTGVLPGAGGDIAALLAYDSAKRSVKHPSAPFGEGTIEGVIAPETANNAAIGGAFIPMLTLGIPGDSITAILIGALTIHGFRPGPDFMTQSPGIFSLVVTGLIAAALLTLLFGLTGIRLFTKLCELPPERLMPMILVLSAVGAYAINNNVYDVIWMFGFGVLGCFMKQYGFPTAPMVLGIILSDLLETNYIRMVRLSGSFGAALLSVFESPISVCLLILPVLFVILPMIRKRAKGFTKDKYKVH